MRHLWLGFAIFAVAAFGTHYLVLKAIPSFVMSKARSTFQERGMPLNYWVASSRITPQTQTVVRPSPDLAYGICLFDVRDGPMLISAPTWDEYGSMSIFDDQTNNVFVTSLKTSDAAPTGIVVARPGQDLGAAVSDRPVVTLKGEGLALIRRLAPTAQTYASAADLIAAAKCEPMTE